MAKVTRLEPKDKPQQQPPQPAADSAVQTTQPIDIHAALLADIRSILQGCYQQLVLLRASQPPPPDMRLYEWERLGKLMDTRGGLKYDPKNIPALRQAQADPVIRIPPPAPPAPAAPVQVGDVDMTFMTEGARARLMGER